MAAQGEEDVYTSVSLLLPRYGPGRMSAHALGELRHPLRPSHEGAANAKTSLADSFC